MVGHTPGLRELSVPMKGAFCAEIDHLADRGIVQRGIRRYGKRKSMFVASKKCRSENKCVSPNIK